MAHAVTIGLDIVKSVFQVHGVDAAGEVVIRRQVRRAQMLAFFAKLPGCLRSTICAAFRPLCLLAMGPAQLSER